ncbi:glycosyltransferase [Sulfurovum sp. zt1-1]|uniref:Glycosyltransferase n=1 Tax=Sulfurovum zhangzhouensis TaxID=3019067 RepID=A0ABT7R1X0_9BACT|nr:glycosyltransferase [Sulfurovum zhangzhouensis]MDM5272541.1 glycosyltransferase [Sulfurovum zhangzhouensis]
MGIKQFIHRMSVHGVLRPIAKPIHSGLTLIAFMCERLLDGLFTAKEDQAFLNEDLTAVIKTFERPEILHRLIKSLRHFYPEMKVIVVDDSFKPTKLEGVETIIMPYDSGVSAGRQEALKHIQTPYMMLLDDDFVFYRHTRVIPVLEKLQKLPEVDIIGGEVIYLPFYRKIDYTKAAIHPTNAIPLRAPGTQIGGMTAYDKVANFYIARTDSIRKVGWDLQIKRLDHADFFTRAKGVLLTVFDPDFKVLHARTPFDREYMSKRLDVHEDRLLLKDKYYFNG